MEIIKRLKTAKKFPTYMEISQDLTNKPKILHSLSFNMSTIITLKNVRSLEIEYFNKCDDSGATFKILERILQFPPSKTWLVLGKEVISLVQYFLDAVRKHLITHNHNWWLFFNKLLVFIKQIYSKDVSMNNILIEECSESLLDLATHGKLNVFQRHAVLHAFNLFSAESTREIRLAYRDKFEHYFIRLGAIMASCGHVPTQYSILEALLRWLLPRQDPGVRKDAASKWLPQHLYPQSAIALFLQRQWKSFFQDARDFFNTHNSQDELVTSIICRKLSVGNIHLLSGTERRQTWLDVNTGSRCMSVLLDSLLLAAAGCPQQACEALVITAERAKEVVLHRESSEITISAAMSAAPQILPSDVAALNADPVRVVVSSRGDLLRLDNALRAVFQDKYHVLLDFNNTLLSPLSAAPKGRSSRDEETRFSITTKETRRKHSGFAVHPRKPVSFRSPSTASTSSLAQLHDRLAALPSYKFDKQPVSVCARPELSDVTEIAESEHSLISLGTTLKLRPGGFIQRRKGLGHLYADPSRNSQSDSEAKNLNTIQEREEIDSQTIRSSQSDVEETYKTHQKDERQLHAHSSLFATIISSADESIIDATVERLPKDKELNTDNLMELLVQEALQAKNKDKEISDSGLNIEEAKKLQEIEHCSEAIENTPFADIIKTSTKPKECTIVIKSSSDESNTEAINDTPMVNVSVRKRTLRKKAATSNEQVEKPISCDVQDVEDFFSQHFSENKPGELMISPTLAKKINETSSETSEDFDYCLISNLNTDTNVEELPDIDIIECLNSMVDKVCNEFEKCTEYLEREVSDDVVMNFSDEMKENNPPLQDIGKNTGKNKMNTPKEVTIAKPNENKNDTPKTSKKTRKIKLKYPKRTLKPKKGAKNKLPLEPVSKMSTILEVNTETDVSVVKNATEAKKSDSSDLPSETSALLRRKRKLYSPNIIDLHKIELENSHEVQNKQCVTLSDSDDDIIVAHFKKNKTTTPKNDPNEATCYKELEKERQKYKKLRTRKSLSKLLSQSPKTKQLNDVFDHLKETVENNEKITLADKTCANDITIFNFTSDSEDEDFKQKKIELQKRISTTTAASGNSIVSTQRGRSVNKVNYTEDGKPSSTDKNAKPSATCKKPTKRNTRTKKIDKESKESLIDERMRETAAEILNTSQIIVQDDTNKKEVLIPNIIEPEQEKVPEENLNTIEQTQDDTKAHEKTVQDNTKTKRARSKSKTIKPKQSERILAVKKEKADSLKVAEQKQGSDKDDDRTVSPLPGLVVETVQSKPHLDDSLTTNMIQKFKRIQQGLDIDTTVTTQHMLSDNERASPANVTEESNRIEKEALESKGNEYPELLQDIEEIANLSTDVNVEELPTTDAENTHKTDGSSSSKKTKRSLRLKSRIPSIIDNSIQEDTITNKSKKSKTKLQSFDELLKGTKSARKETTKSGENSTTPCVNTITTRSKSKSQEKLEIETINISDVTERKSEKSIATIGINAHGDVDELPPSSEAFQENLMPREIEDMDKSTKEYYMELREELNLSHVDSTKKNYSRRSVKESDAKKNKNYDTISVKTSTPQKKEDNPKTKNLRKCLRSRKDSSSSEEKSVSVRVHCLSSADIAKWLPSRRDSSSDQEDVPNISNEDLRKWLPSPRSSVSGTSKKSSVKLPVKELKARRTETEKTELKRTEKRLSNQGQETKRKSLISSIRLKFDARNTTKNETLTSRFAQPFTSGQIKDSAKKYITRSVTKESKNTSLESNKSNVSKEVKSAEKRKESIVRYRVETREQEDVEFLTSSVPNQGQETKRKSLISPIRLNETLSSLLRFDARNTTKNETLTSRFTQPSTSGQIRDSAKKYITRSVAKESKNTSLESNKSSVSKEVKSAEKRKGSILRYSVEKRKKQEDVEVLQSSVPSASSVDEWFKRNTVTQQDDAENCLKDVIQNVIEKVDTTLPEIHQNTSKNFIHLFVDCQKYLTERKAERHEMYKQTVVNIFSRVTKVIDEEFTALDRRSSETDTEFNNWLKQRATEFIKLDCRQKHALVLLLKEDAQAALEHMAKNEQRRNE